MLILILTDRLFVYICHAKNQNTGHMRNLLKHAIRSSILVFILTLTGCVDYTAGYIVYNHENDGGQVPLYLTADIEASKPFKYVDSNTQCALIEVKPAKGVHQIGLGEVTHYATAKSTAEEMLYVKSSFVREKLTKYKVGVIAGGGEYDRFKRIYQNCSSPVVKRAYETIHKWQESKFHYRWTNLTALGGLIASLLIFFIVLAIARINESKFKPLFVFAAFLTGLLFLFFQIVNFVVLGGGYVPFIDFHYPDNFWGAILPALPYLVNLVLLSLVMAAVLYTPYHMGVVIARNRSNTAKEEKITLSLNIAGAVIAYIGTFVTLMITYDFHIAFIIVVSIVTAFYIFMTIRELLKGNFMGLLYLLFPLIYIITGASLYRIGSIVLHMIIVVFAVAILAGAIITGLADGEFNPFAGGSRGNGGPLVSLDGQELDELTPSHGYRNEFRNPANGKCYGSNDGGRTLTEI